MKRYTPKTTTMRRRQMIDAARKQNHGLLRCRLCKCSLKTTFVGTQPGSLATVDHILPRSLGGSHDRENLRLVCRWCNEMLALFGHCAGAVAAARAAIGKQDTAAMVKWRAGRFNPTISS